MTQQIEELKANQKEDPVVVPSELTVEGISSLESSEEKNKANKTEAQNGIMSLFTSFLVNSNKK